MHVFSHHCTPLIYDVSSLPGSGTLTTNTSRRPSRCPDLLFGWYVSADTTQAVPLTSTAEFLVVGHLTHAAALDTVCGVAAGEGTSSSLLGLCGRWEGVPGGGRDLVISVNTLTVNRAQCWTLQVTQEGIRDHPYSQGVFSLCTVIS